MAECSYSSSDDHSGADFSTDDDEEYVDEEYINDTESENEEYNSDDDEYNTDDDFFDETRADAAAEPSILYFSKDKSIQYSSQPIVVANRTMASYTFRGKAGNK